jgi:hypothetical protein
MGCDMYIGVGNGSVGAMAAPGCRSAFCTVTDGGDGLTGEYPVVTGTTLVTIPVVVGFDCVGIAVVGGWGANDVAGFGAGGHGRGTFGSTMHVVVGRGVGCELGTGCVVVGKGGIEDVMVELGAGIAEEKGVNDVDGLGAGGQGRGTFGSKMHVVVGRGVGCGLGPGCVVVGDGGVDDVMAEVGAGTLEEVIGGTVVVGTGLAVVMMVGLDTTEVLMTCVAAIVDALLSRDEGVGYGCDDAVML